MDPFRVSGNSLGAHDWDGRPARWFTGADSTGRWEDISCGARFKADMNAYLGTAGTKYRSIQVPPGPACI